MEVVRGSVMIAFPEALIGKVVGEHQIIECLKIFVMHGRDPALRTVRALIAQHPGETQTVHNISTTLELDITNTMI